MLLFYIVGDALNIVGRAAAKGVLIVGRKSSKFPQFIPSCRSPLGFSLRLEGHGGAPVAKLSRPALTSFSGKKIALTNRVYVCRCSL